MRARRSELGNMTIAEAAAAARISPTTWTSVELGRPHRVASHIERALGWLPGSVEAIEAGGVAQLDPAFEARRGAACQPATEPEPPPARDRLVVVDLSGPGDPLVVLAATGAAGISETTRRALLAQAQKAIEVARRASGDEGQLQLSGG